MVKTNAIRMVDKFKIDYNVKSLDLKEAVDGVTCANMLLCDVNSTFKTLVTVSKSGNHYVFVVPVEKKLSLKKAASIVCEKNVEMVHSKDLLSLTGYVHGGCSPIGMKKFFDTFIDDSALNYDKIVFSAGKIGLFIEMNPKDLSKVIKVKFESLVEE